MSTTEKETIINGYRVELDLDGPDGTTQCFVSKGSYSASLQGLLYTGCLTDSGDREIRVNESIVDAIEAWALAEGY